MQQANMESLVGKFYKKLDATDVSFVRDRVHKDT